MSRRQSTVLMAAAELRARITEGLLEVVLSKTDSEIDHLDFEQVMSGLASGRFRLRSSEAMARWLKSKPAGNRSIEDREHGPAIPVTISEVATNARVETPGRGRCVIEFETLVGRPSARLPAERGSGSSGHELDRFPPSVLDVIAGLPPRVSREQAWTALGISKSELDRLLHESMVIPFQKEGRRVLILRLDLAAYLARQVGLKA